MTDKPKRAYLTEREKLALLVDQAGACAMCGEALGYHKAEFDHSTPVALGNGKKPDQALCRPCHKAKSAKDVKAIAKTKRIQRKYAGKALDATSTVEARHQKPKRAIKSRGFDKTLRRRMNGRVEKRT